jgi:thymidine kinase
MGIFPIFTAQVEVLHMFIEPNYGNQKAGWIEVIVGSMFSGKTEELIRRLRRAQIANQKVAIFKPAIDTRYSETAVVSHLGASIPSEAVTSSQQILLLVEGMKVVAIDEAQFFDHDIVDVARRLANSGIRVIVAGLDMDFTGKPFGPIPALLANAEFVTKVHAICQQCGALANYSFRKAAGSAQVLLGEKDSYEPRCRHCFYN